MSADGAIHFLLCRDCLNHVPGLMTVPKAGSLLFAPHHPLREETMNNGGPDGWAILDRSIHESPAYLKFDRTCLVGSTL